ncbi:GCN5-related N-acetyltransferase [Caenispirillum salinarum AK4]|uniref:GCN5-related N-acetyltransferase n=1 Tax=Caenispirillum salinarum AK4 TaxID=1238182 RepID=K9GWF7_9PROT|nr:N-acetyltransferase [Caenispirillum salinarum]EKV29582.1 GCN5-related N-acetyltransferase [Caenispirillum salinarum AK4]
MMIVRELPGHGPAIDRLLEKAFGPGRHGKTVYRLRQDVPSVDALNLVAVEGSEVVGTIRFWPIVIGPRRVPAVLLGPIAVDEDYRSLRIGSQLMNAALERCADEGHRIVILVGDEPYYRRFGFRRDLCLDLDLPGPVDPARFLGLELVEGAMNGLTGMIDRPTPQELEAPATVPVLPGSNAAAAAKKQVWVRRAQADTLATVTAA